MSHKSQGTEETRKIESESAQQKQKTIMRCPKCRSINPIDAKYCYNCGKVFE